jgi:hypothetical protein
MFENIPLDYQLVGDRKKDVGFFVNIITQDSRSLSYKEPSLINFLGFYLWCSPLYLVGGDKEEPW